MAAPEMGRFGSCVLGVGLLLVTPASGQQAARLDITVGSSFAQSNPAR
jgi:hypothetical protein